MLLFCLAFLLLYLIAMSSFMLTVFAGAVGSSWQLKQDLAIAGGGQSVH
jgi:hypothetical protein